VLASAPESDHAFVANYQTLGYLRGDRLVLLHPKRKTEVLRFARHRGDEARVDGRGGEARLDDAGALREAIAFYSAASYVFRHGLYRDEEQTPPEQRAALIRLRGGG